MKAELRYLDPKKMRKKKVSDKVFRFLSWMGEAKPWRNEPDMVDKFGSQWAVPDDLKLNREEQDVISSGEVNTTITIGKDIRIKSDHRIGVVSWAERGDKLYVGFVKRQCESVFDDMTTLMIRSCAESRGAESRGAE